ncbi:structure-specific endonuclease subunit SLX4 [Orycteropus afer afer]|uniref:Structure-specific endonuclease subunit SLX4 n=1 Tax=Orycteropus afer afer TaxID=1230840 RepID=A0AC54Z780_ORYAF|nr:structure-specific endonuclease subunit SLX4 [Orycteropus afer afer]
MVLLAQLCRPFSNLRSQPERLEAGQAMDESDDDFKELCASFFQRVKKNGTKGSAGERKKQKASSSTQISSQLKGPRQPRSKALRGPAQRKAGSQARRAPAQGAAKQRARKPTRAVNGEGHAAAPAFVPSQPVLGDSAQGTQPGKERKSVLECSHQKPGAFAPSSDAQPPPPGLTAVAPSPSKPRTAELVLQRMQQFKRADPTRLKHASGVCSLEVAIAENAPKDPPEETVVGNGCGPGPPATESDTAVALALQQELGQERASACEEGLEQEGWFFCQICQKDLSAMNVIRREQHINRCLDEAEKSLRPSAPQIPECPICGKLFLTFKSRSGHLKQCAVKMEVCPQLLLQAVRLQTAQLEEGCSPAAQSLSHQVGSLKRKGASSMKEPQKRRKVSQPEVPSEDLLVAMALSRSEVEQSGTVQALNLESAFSERTKLGAEKKSRRKKLPASLPPLLAQDSAATWQWTGERVVQLFAEEVGDLPSTPPLPASRILKKESEEAGWQLQLPEGRRNLLWEGSALAGSWASEAFYTASLVPPIVPRRPAQGPAQEPPCPLMPPDLPKSGVCTPPAHRSPLPVCCSPREDPAEPVPREASPSSSQREHQALQDLMDLAREGLVPSGRSLDSWGGAAAIDLVPSGLPLSGFVPPPEEEHLQRGSDTSLSLGLLVSDFGAMVNNPHLSDVQFQVDSGEVLYAHKFVLYARCPLLIQHVNSEGFFAVEDEDLRTQRALLSDVRVEVAHAFLRYLYTADAAVSSHLAPDLRTLALRFGVRELVRLCEQVPLETDVEHGPQQEEEDKDCESRADNFQELLRSMWGDEEEEAEAPVKHEGREDREEVDEADMEEIYEFAATQRKLLREERAAERGGATGQRREGSPGPGGVCAGVLLQAQLEEVVHKPSEPGSNEAQGRWTSGAQSAPLSQGEQPPSVHHAETREREAVREAPGRCRSSSPPGESRAGGKEGPCLHSMEDSEQLSSLTRGDHPERPQVTGDQEEQRSPVMERGPEASCSPRYQQAPAPGGSPSWPHLHPCYAGGMSPLVPRSQSADSKMASWDTLSPILSSKHRRDSSIPALLTDPEPEEGKASGPMWARSSRGPLVSPEKSLSIDLTQSDSGDSRSRRPPAPSAANREDEVILLLDSDEELELKRTPAGSLPDDAPEERKVLAVSPRSSELFSVIDIDADLEQSPSPLGREGRRPQGAGELLETQGSVGGRRRLQLFCDSSPEEDSTVDTSWLVPATPLSSRGRHHSSKTHASPLRSRTSALRETHLEPRAVSEVREAEGATGRFPAIVPQTAAPRLVSATPGNPETGGQASRSPPGHRPRPHQLLSPMASCRPPRPSPERHRLGRATVGEVVEVEDSDDEQGVALHPLKSSPLPDGEPPIPIDTCFWSAEPLSPIPIDHLNLERTGPLSTSSPGHRARQAPAYGSPGLLDTSPIRGSRPHPGGAPERSSRAGPPGSSRLSLLNSALWDDWDGEERSPEMLPLAQRLSADRADKPGGPETPQGARRKKNLPPKVPITPMPRYSIMETPVLKKELDRFGVRPLPKRQMVMKLKEIFQYTHQTLESDSEDEIPSSQVPPRASSSLAWATEAPKTSRTAGPPPPEATTSLIPPRPKGPTEHKSPRRRRKPPRESSPSLHRPAAAEAPPASDGDAQLPASQESTATLVDSSDGSFGSQSSSSGEFGAALMSEGDNEGEEGVSASQAAVRAADMEEAVWRYIRSQPALYRKVLLYQPLELTELQAELRHHGIRVATGRLLDFLDAQCVTFTTAAARKEQLDRKRRQPAGKQQRARD